MSKNRKNTPDADNPFAHLSSLVRQAGISLHPEEKPQTPPPKSEIPESRQQAEDPDQVFAEAMEGVARIHWRQDPAPSGMTPPQTACADPEALDERLFHEAIAADLIPPILDHPEYIEGWVGVAGQRFLRNLRAGDYSIQGSIDLHGYSRFEAREVVEAFIIRMSRERSCCVKIVHGRGINSPSDRAILKEHLQRWLATRRMSRHVVAYASAPYTDGGVGAIYVLLRHSQYSRL